MMRPYRSLMVCIFLLACSMTFGQQQDVVLHLNSELLNSKTILKIKHDFHDPYLWVLAKNNEVYRVNTSTLAVDDYTPQFAAFNNLRFIDVAGRSKDTVFIATQSDGMIQYERGNPILVTFAGTTLTSIGVDYSRRVDFNFSGNNPYGNVLLVGTVKGLYRYDMDANTSVFGSSPISTLIFDASYRRVLYTGTFSNYPDTVTYYPVVFTNPNTIYQGYLWLNNTTFGADLRTAFYTPYAYSDEDYVYGDNLFWGTEKGLSENNWNNSYSTQWPAAHYLDGIPVNKITDIFGLTAFGSISATGNQFGADPGLTRQNLLVGTDNGLYFSNSLLDKYQAVNGLGTGLRDFALFHYNELGNIRVNDICVNIESTVWPVCEDGVWVACDNGLYLIKPDYAQFLNNRQLDVAVFKNMNDTISSLKICSGTSVTAMVSNDDYSGNSFQWYKNGQELPGKSLDSLAINADGDYYAVLYEPCQNTHIETNHLTVHVISAPVFSFNYPDKLQYCDSTSTTLKTDYSPNYRYRWYTDGSLNGDTTYQYAVTQSGKYKVEVSACTNSWVPSKEIEVDLINLPLPVVTADKAKYCAGEVANLNVNVPVDPGYTINWYKDGNIIQADQNKTNINLTDDGNYSITLTSTIASCTKSATGQQITFTPVPLFSFNYPDKLAYCSGTPVALTAEGSNSYHYRWYFNGKLNSDTLATENITQGGKYKVEVSACEGSWVSSKEVQVDLISIPVPVVQTDKAAYCIGDNATMNISVTTDPAYTINWYRDNVLLNANVNQTSLTTNADGNYTVVITSNETNTDGTVCSQTSTRPHVIFNPLPTLSIQKIVKTTLCDGQTVDLKVSYSDGTVKWNTNENSDLISVSKSGTYTATITSVASCTSNVSINVQFFPNPALALPNTGVCVRSHKTSTLTAPAGMTSYVWNGQAGDQTYVVDHPQSVTLTVTDANGCTATQDIEVNDECPDIVIPNAFTPNGDGINDTWDIKGLEYDPSALVRIFTRYGQEVYESRGYNKPWDGTSKGKQLISGTYYYIINAKNSTQTYSGSVTIIY